MFDPFIAYCGALPITWSRHLLSIAGLLALVAAHAFIVLMLGASGPTMERVASVVGRLILGAALISPFFYLGIALL
jgi:hypothetical protein